MHIVSKFGKLFVRGSQQGNYLVFLCKYLLLTCVFICFLSEIFSRYNYGQSIFQRNIYKNKPRLMRIYLHIFPNHALTYGDFLNLVRPMILRQIDMYNNQFNGGTFSFSDQQITNQPLCIGKCRQKIVSEDWGGDMKWSNDQWARWFYELGVASYADGDISGSARFMDLARHLSPEWTFLHIELANVYFRQHQYNEAQVVLEECRRITHTENYCSGVVNEMREGNFDQAVGFLSQKIVENISF